MTFSNLLIVLPDLKPKVPINGIGVFCESIEIVNSLLSLMNSWVRFCLLMLTAIVGCSEVIWNNAFAICPFILSSFFEQMIYSP